MLNANYPVSIHLLINIFILDFFFFFFPQSIGERGWKTCTSREPLMGTVWGWDPPDPLKTTSALLSHHNGIAIGITSL